MGEQRVRPRSIQHPSGGLCYLPVFNFWINSYRRGAGRGQGEQISKGKAQWSRLMGRHEQRHGGETLFGERISKSSRWQVKVPPAHPAWSSEGNILLMQLRGPELRLDISYLSTQVYPTHLGSPEG